VRILIAAVGRAKGPATKLFEEYRNRLDWTVTTREVVEHKKLPPKALMAREAALLLAALPADSGGRLKVVALDESGKSLDSAGFAALIGRWRDQGVGEIAFLIGGADGLGEAARSRADLVLSLGAMTWPHQLVRALLAEQLYRARQILAGHPYHRA